MVEDKNGTAEQTVDPSDTKKTKEGAKLSSDFFSQLINQPRCETHGECDGCGRCER